ncbi:MAG TPA: transglycosylase SLT domain-containing protein [Gammaproteobacteria bacterium]
MGNRICAVILLLVFSSPQNLYANTGSDMDLKEQRARYLEARRAFHKKENDKFLELAESLQDYPLYPYLRYNYLTANLSKTGKSEIEKFLSEQSDFPSIELLRQRWLKYLAATKQWETFVKNYIPQNNDKLRCYYLLALMNSKDNVSLLDETRKVWLSGTSLPSQCDSAFELLYKSALMNDDLVWERFALAVKKNNFRLANYLAEQLSTEYRGLANIWIAIRKDPAKLSAKPGYADNSKTRQIIIDGLIRLSRYNINASITRWALLEKQYNFTPEEENEVDRKLAILAALKEHPSATMLLDNIPRYYADETIFHWRLVTALKNSDWEKLKEWTTGVPVTDTVKYRWYYWHARALEKTGEHEQASRVYGLIANDRDYYGFMAADRLGSVYNMRHAATPEHPELHQAVLALPAIQRAYELDAIGERYESREEWLHALTYLEPEQKKIAACLASEWGWHDLAIITLASAGAYDYLDMRFPLPYRDLIYENAKQYQLDTGWVYSLVRSESAFVEDIKSPTGALGLMQLMPRTAQETARKLGVSNFRTRHLLSAEKNVILGSKYLRQMLDKYKGNMVLATAAYNAGPNRVDKWLSKSGCSEPDIWIEQIPFTETRKYVSRIMFYASIYDWRLQREIRNVSSRMTLIPAATGLNIAGLACSGQQLSYN